MKNNKHAGWLCCTGSNLMFLEFVVVQFDAIVPSSWLESMPFFITHNDVSPSAFT